MDPKLTRRDFVKSVTAGAASIGISQFLPSSARGADKAAAEFYDEKYRPQFHFTPKTNWTNDPNGLVFYKGEYHLFFQHNPFGINWGNMTWGHAVSNDLLHWKQLANAIEPDELGTIFSGSAVVDWKNTSGLQTGAENVLVALYTAAGEFASPKKKFTQCLAYSNDRGRTWVKYNGNPVIGNIRDDERDPKAIWHEPTKKWVMALFLDKDNEFAILVSPNLINWEISQTFTIDGSRECPDLFPMKIEGEPGNEKWIFRGGNGKYKIGGFDGRKFTPETGVLDSVTGNYYAVQTWSDIPEQDGRTLQIAWMAEGEFPGMPFNQQMSIPCELTLRTLPEGIRLCHRPVREIENIRNKLFAFTNVALEQGGNPLKEITGDLFEIEAEIEIAAAREITFVLRGTPMVYNVPDKALTCRGERISLSPINGKVRFHILVDRASIEIFPNEGNMCIFLCFPLDAQNKSLGVHSVGGQAKAIDLKVWTLKSVWFEPGRPAADMSNDGIVNFLDWAILTGP